MKRIGLICNTYPQCAFLKNKLYLCLHCNNLNKRTQQKRWQQKKRSPYTKIVCESKIVFCQSGHTAYAIVWSSRISRRVSRSTSTAKVLAAGNAVDQMTNLKHLKECNGGLRTTKSNICSRSDFYLCSILKEAVEVKKKYFLHWWGRKFIQVQRPKFDVPRGSTTWQMHW